MITLGTAAQALHLSRRQVRDAFRTSGALDVTKYPGGGIVEQIDETHADYISEAAKTPSQRKSDLGIAIDPHASN